MTAVVETVSDLARRRLATPRGMGWLGVALGVLAFWLALPPVMARGLLVPGIVGALGMAAGAWAVRGGAGRVGWGGIVAGAAGIGLGLLATLSSAAALDKVFVWSALIAATLRAATPLTFAALGGLFSERSGVVNIGLEGMMLTGAFFGFYGADKFGAWWWGILLAVLAGGILALVHAFVSIQLRADQIVSGTAVNFLALGVTGYLFVDIYKDQGTPGAVSKIPDVSIPWVKDLYFIGPAIGKLHLLTWVALALIAVTYVVVFRTPAGLRIRAVGEHPKAADTVGISVYAVRYIAVGLSGVLAATGGAYLSNGGTHSFNEGMTNGRGFIALAALIFGRWRPVGAFAACLLFGFSEALGLRLPGAYGEDQAWTVLFKALPYVLTLVAVAGVIGRSIPPASVGRPYVKQ